MCHKITKILALKIVLQCLYPNWRPKICMDVNREVHIMATNTMIIFIKILFVNFCYVELDFFLTWYCFMIGFRSKQNTGDKHSTSCFGCIVLCMSAKGYIALSNSTLYSSSKSTKKIFTNSFR